MRLAASRTRTSRNRSRLNGDDGNHHQELDQGERRTALAHRILALCMNLFPRTFPQVMGP